jgi:hypothetical protein
MNETIGFVLMWIQVFEKWNINHISLGNLPMNHQSIHKGVETQLMFYILRTRGVVCAYNPHLIVIEYMVMRFYYMSIVLDL